MHFRSNNNKFFNKTCNMHLSFRNLNPTPTKNLLAKFQNLYIFTNNLSIESLLHHTFLFIKYFNKTCNLHLSFKN